MDSFPFTKKRFLSLPQARRHKWVAIWLKQIYRDLLDERVSSQSLDLLFRNYLRIQSWLGVSPPLQNKPSDNREWIEFISERFHDHRKKTGLGLAEPDFLPRVVTGDRDTDKPWKSRIPYRVALDSLRSAFNVGSIFRLTDGAGFESIMMNHRTPGKEHRQVKKAAMGSAEWIPQEKNENLASALKRSKISGYRIVGIETVANSSTYLEYPWPSKGIVVLGNEEFGLSKEVMETCDDFVHLPMFGKKNSINVANAFAVIAFHICSLKIAIDSQ
ncbi:MAG: RNA methyltransferase [Proteobacteria bacterium]|nr:RNA methyltransferase [Pseudomonadota bacterium]